MPSAFTTGRLQGGNGKLGNEKATEEVARAVQQLALVVDKHVEKLEGFFHRVIVAAFLIHLLH